MIEVVILLILLVHGFQKFGIPLKSIKNIHLLPSFMENINMKKHLQLVLSQELI